MSVQNELTDDLKYRVRWVLGEETPDEPHCAACLQFAGEYENYRTMLEQTADCVPGYFVDWAFDPEEYEMNPNDYKGIACQGLCRCHMEIKIGEDWLRIMG